MPKLLLPERTRREFLRLAGLLGAALSVSRCRNWERADTGPVLCAEHDVIGVPPTGEALDLPHLGGAPDTPEGRAIAAFVDTIVPGRHRDETGAPGAIDVGVPAVFFDPALPFCDFASLLAQTVDYWATQVKTGTTFVELSYADRERAIEEAVQVFPEMQYAVQIVHLAHYSSAGAACMLGYPGANDGYADDPDLSFGEALTTEITDDGNLP